MGRFISLRTASPARVARSRRSPNQSPPSSPVRSTTIVAFIMPTSSTYTRYSLRKPMCGW
jgi:hypothetical protein